MNLQPVPVGFEPSPDIAVLVVRSIVLNQNGSLAAVSPSQLFEESQIGAGIENRCLAIVEARTPQFDCAKNLHVMPLAGDRHLRRVPYPAPGGVERRVLPEAGFVCEDECPVSQAGFFLSAG